MTAGSRLSGFLTDFRSQGTAGQDSFVGPPVHCRPRNPEDPVQAPEQKDTAAATPAPAPAAQAGRQPARDADAVELAVEEVEERITPRLASNHNETFLVDR